MKTSTKRAVWMVSVLALTNWFAAGADVNSSKPGGSYNESSSAAEPREYNKASGIVGMDVQNEQGQHLGHIKDIVFDLNSQKISYAVMTTASKAMPVEEKLLAVPINAFTVSTDQKHLVLNADKAKVDAAAGFSSKNWPNVSNPAWGAEPFWQQKNSAPGNMTPGSSTTPRQ